MFAILPGWLDRGNRVVAVGATGPTAADAFGSEPASLERTMFFNRFLAVFRAGRQVAALPAQPG